MELTAFQTFNVGILVLFAGRYLNRRLEFLRAYNIPEPVTGGILASVALALLYFVFGIATEFELTARDALLLYFFTAIGLNADFRTLLQGGKPLVLLLVATLVYMVIQNLVGVSVAAATGVSSVVGVIGGTASLIGGHGTTIAWAPIFVAEHGVPKALEIGVACATVGLILAALMGGPIARLLITRHGLEPEVVEQPDIGLTYDNEASDINYANVLAAWLVLNIAIGLGLSLNEILEDLGYRLPNFLACMFVAILMTNTIPHVSNRVPWPAGSASVGLISDISLGVFLAMSLMSMQLWLLVDLAVPVLSILAAQLVVALLYTIFVVFNLMGRDYEAAVVCSGFSGYALGATPTAMANMSAVAKTFGGAHRAFVIVPLVGAFFIDIANKFIIQFFLGL